MQKACAIIAVAGVASAANDVLVKGKQVWDQDAILTTGMDSYAEFQEDGDTADLNDYVALDKIGNTIVASRGDDEFLEVIKTGWDGNHSSYFLNVRIDAPDSDYDSTFGATLDAVGDHVTGELIFTSGLSTATTAYDGMGYVFKGGNSVYTLQATLFPDRSDYGTTIPATDNFGADVSADPVSLRHVAFVCGTCSKGVADESSVLLFNSDPSATKWSAEASLRTTDQTNYGFGWDGVSLYDDLLITSGNNAADSLHGTVIFKRDRGVWSEQQILKLENTLDTLDFEVYEDTIFVSKSTTYLTRTDAGEIEVFEPSAFVPGPKGKPQQWSLSQTIRAPYASTVDFSNYAFGSNFDVEGDTLFVQDDAYHTYFYAKSAGKWSVQQIFHERVADTSDAAIAGVVLDDTSAIATWDDVSRTYSNNQEWNCIDISVEDQFGDGWSGAQLEIVAPNGQIERFAPSCWTANPWVFRYCPADASVGGLYKVSVPRALDYQFYWEILWRAAAESTDEWVVGNHATQLDFHWDVKTSSFKALGARHTLPSNITCVDTCKEQPPSKPSPSRSLKAGSPTVSPAPTLDNTETANWRFFTKASDASQWFEWDHTGASYWITDINAKRVISTGTLCQGVEQTCWEDLRDGDYQMRVGGALSAQDRTDLSWDFCKVHGFAQEGIIFTVKGGECIGYYNIMRDEICEAATWYELAYVNIILSGAELFTDISGLSSNDKLALNTAVANVLGLKVDDVKLVSVENSMYSFAVKTDMSSSSFADMLDAPSAMANLLTVHAGGLAIAIKSSDISATFNSISGITIDSVSLNKIEHVVATQAIQDTFVSASSSEELKTVDNSNVVVTEEFAFLSAIGGYVLVGVGMLLIAFYIVKSRNTIDATPVPVAMVSTSSSNVKEVEVQLPTIVHKEPTKTKTPELADLKKFIKDEDEWLSRTKI